MRATARVPGPALAVVLSVVLVVAAVAWSFLRGERGDPGFVESVGIRPEQQEVADAIAGSVEPDAPGGSGGREELTGYGVGAALRGRVVLAGANPLLPAGVAAEVLVGGMSTIDNAPHRPLGRVSCGPEGRFEIALGDPMFRGRKLIWLQPEVIGFAAHERCLVRLEDLHERPYEEVTLPVHDGFRVQGRVVDPVTREGVADARVTAYDFEAVSARARPSADARVSFVAAHRGAVRSDPSGSFVVVLPERGSYRFDASGDGRSGSAHLRPWSPPTIEIELERRERSVDALVRGVVVDPAGRAVEGARVHVVSELVRRVDADDSGRFEVELHVPDVDRPVSIVAAAPGFAPGHRNFDLARHADVVEVRLGRAFRIAGRIHFADDVPQSDRWSWVTLHGGSRLEGERSEVLTPLAVAGSGRVGCDRDGRFEFVGVPAGEYVVHAASVRRSASERYEAWATARAGDRNVELFVGEIREPSVAWDVTVRAAPSGVPIVGAEVRVHALVDGLVGLGMPIGRSGEDGRAHVAAVFEESASEAAFRIEVTAQGFGRWFHSASYARGVHALDVELAEECSLEVVVVDGSGVPWPGVVVHVEDRAARPVESFGVLQTDSMGRVELQGLPARRLWLRARPRGVAGPFVEREVDLSGGGERRVEFGIEG